MSRRRNDSDDSSDDDEGKCLKSGYSICTGLDALACSAFFSSSDGDDSNSAVGKMRN